MPDLPNSMTETTEDCSSHDNIFAIFSNLDSDLRPLDPSSPDELVRPSSAAVSTDSEVMFISPPTSPLMLLPNQISNDEPVSPDSTSTVEASDSDPAVEASPTAGVQCADGTNEYQHELPPAYSFPTDCTPLLPRPNQFEHRTKTANSVHNYQHRSDSLVSKPDSSYSTTDQLPTSLWLETRVQLLANYPLGQPTERTDYSESSFVYPMHHGSPRSCCCLSSFRTLISLDAFFKLYPVPPSFPLSPKSNFVPFHYRSNLTKNRSFMIL